MKDKAQARFVEYIVTVSLSIVVVVIVFSLVWSFYNSVIENEIREELKQLTIHVYNNIIKLYDLGENSKASPANYSIILIGDIDLNLPASVSRRNYQIILFPSNLLWSQIQTFTIDGKNVSVIIDTPGGKIVAKTTQDPKVTVTYDIPNLDVEFQGFVDNNRDAKLKYYRYNINNTIYNKIVLGNPDILATISGIS